MIKIYIFKQEVERLYPHPLYCLFVLFILYDSVCFGVFALFIILVYRGLTLFLSFLAVSLLIKIYFSVMRVLTVKQECQMGFDMFCVVLDDTRSITVGCSRMTSALSGLLNIAYAAYLDYDLEAIDESLRIILSIRSSI